MKIKEVIFMMGLVIIIVLVIGVINSFKSNGNHEEEEMQCIADNSKLIVSKTCGHCANQKNILGEHLNKFELLYINENPELWDEYNIGGVPTWIINEKEYPGVRSISKLKELTNC